MKKIDFRTVAVKKIDGSMEKVDMDYQGLANYIYNETKDLGELEMARRLYKTGSLELDSKSASALRVYVEQAFGAVVHEALFPVLDDIINNLKK